MRIPERTISRSKYCGNCTHFVRGREAEERFTLLTGLQGGDLAWEAVQQLKGEPLINKRVADLMKTGLTEHQALDRLLQSKYKQLQDMHGMAPDVWKAIKDGDVGYCNVKALEADFATKAELCGDSNGKPCLWVGIPGAAHVEKTPLSDAPIDEVRDVIDTAARHRPKV